MVNTRKKKEKTPEEDTSAQESDANKESAVDSSQPTTEDEGRSEESKPSSGLRLVPLNLLLKPEIVNPPKKPSPRKSRSAKKSSYVEVSSEESDQEQISVPSSSESSDTEALSKKKLKRTKSGKINNGTSSEVFKEPKSPAKIGKASSKNLSVNLNKMPGNVNKLMKSYKVESETSVLSWSESDDFENMIETSKIDRAAPDKEKDITDVCSTSQASSPQKKRGPKPKDEKPPAKKLKQDTKKLDSSSADEKGPTRSRSTRHAVVNRKKVVDPDTSSSEESENEVPPVSK